MKDLAVGDRVWWVNYSDSIYSGTIAAISRRQFALATSDELHLIDKDRCFRSEIDAQLSAAQKLMNEGQSAMKKANDLFNAAAAKRQEENAG